MIVAIVIFAATNSSDRSIIHLIRKDDEQEIILRTNKSAKEKLVISNPSVMDKGHGIREVVGEVKNNDSISRIATLKATFYDSNGKILGTAVGAVSDIAPGETKTFNLITIDNINGYKEMKVQVDTLL